MDLQRGLSPSFTADSFGQPSDNWFTSAVNREVREDEGVHMDISDDPDKLTDALLAFLDAQSQGQGLSLAGSAAQIPEQRQIQDQADATYELVPEHTPFSTPNTGALASCSSVLSLSFEGPSTQSRFTSRPDAIEVSETVGNGAHQAETATDAVDSNLPIINTDLATSEAIDNNHDADTDAFLAPQPPAISNPASNDMAQSIVRSSRKRQNCARRSRDNKRKKKEAKAAQLEIEAGILVEDTQWTTRVAVDRDDNPIAIPRARTSTHSTSNHIPNDEVLPEHPSQKARPLTC